MESPSESMTAVQAPLTQEMQDVLFRAQQGDLTVLPALRILLDNRAELWKEVGDLSKHSEMTLLSMVAGNNLLAKEAISRKLNELRLELGGTSPTPLERLLIDRIALCWLHLNFLEIDAMASLGKDRGMTQTSVYAQRRLDSAQRRYLQAVKGLAAVRKLLPPPSSVLTKRLLKN